MIFIIVFNILSHRNRNIWKNNRLRNDCTNDKPTQKHTRCMSFDTLFVIFLLSLQMIHRLRMNCVAVIFRSESINVLNSTIYVLQAPGCVFFPLIQSSKCIYHQMRHERLFTMRSLAFDALLQDNQNREIRIRLCLLIMH